MQDIGNCSFLPVWAVHGGMRMSVSGPCAACQRANVCLVFELHDSMPVLVSARRWPYFSNILQHPCVQSSSQWRIAGIVLNLTCSCVRKLNHRGVVVKKFHGVCILVLDADSNVEATGSPEAVRMMIDEQKQTNTIEMRRRAHRVPAKEVVEIIIRFILPPFHSPPSTSNPPHKITPH
jgi:hypothetical protein